MSFPIPASSVELARSLSSNTFTLNDTQKANADVVKSIQDDKIKADVISYKIKNDNETLYNIASVVILGIAGMALSSGGTSNSD